MVDVNVYRIPMTSPDDISELEKLIDSGEINPKDITAILAKTEGNGCVNDFTRGFSSSVFSGYIAKKLGITSELVKDKVAFIMSGGCEGIMSPHATIFTVREVKAEEHDSKSLALSVGFTRNFKPEEYGTKVMVDEVRDSVLMLINKAGIDQIDDVHFVQIKTPLLTSDRIKDAHERGKNVVVDDTYKSMGYTRGAAALGVAIALNEIEESKVTSKSILNDFSLYSNVASTSAGVELENCEIIVMGNSKNSISKYFIGHSVMQDSIDIRSIVMALNNVGLEVDQLPTEEHKNRIVNVFAKAEAAPDGYVRGRRNTMMTDSDYNHTRAARSVVNAVISAFTGDPMVYVSGGAEHQGPSGGGPIAVIIKK